MEKNQVLEYLLQNEDFHNWVISGDNDTYWSNWLSENADFRDEFDEAREVIQSLAFEKKGISRQQIEVARVKFWEAVDSDPVKSEPAKIFPIFRRWVSYAAAIALVVFSTWGVYNLLLSGPSADIISEEIVDQVREIALPDSTIVTLNTNSKISYDFEEAKNLRAVILEGEAFFNVTKLNVNNKPQKFEVKTKDLTVSVLGTSFNVDEGPLGTTVVLEEGSIELRLEGQTTSILMEPGDKIVYSREEGIIDERLVSPENYSSWKNGVLTLDGKNLGEVSNWLERRYNIEIDIAEDRKNIGLSGSVSTEELSEAIKAISLAAGVESTQINNEKWKLN
ncbi:FecR family protein [Membranihabitans maritimus]|uniref:FecR family protein n=1 Tax=Membranihabitans maritimus TaxID=2904244 RepID=UPI001F40967A|nr:FecR domain-containing protein [Membranihabitans maritimus]